MKKRELLLQEYDNLIKKYSIQTGQNIDGINYMIKQLLGDFCRQCERPALWCNGVHTSSLMSDFMFEMKNVKYIVDKFQKPSENSGFYIISPDSVMANAIDGIIISTFRWRDEVKEEISKFCPDIKCLDLYDELAQNGFLLTGEYYAQGSPYTYYHKVNRLLRKLLQPCRQDEQENIYRELIEGFIVKKDFRTATVYAEKIYSFTGKEIYQELIQDIDRLYHLELQMAGEIPSDNVLMCCIDGLRRKDVLEKMPTFKKYIDQNALFCENAYLVSTSTFESLIPAFSCYKNKNLVCYDESSIKEEDCPFICKAKEQGRSVHFYTDATPYIDTDYVDLTKSTQTVTEKMWNFIVDACDEGNGLFYVHILYESHFAFPNPYTLDELITFGSVIILEYIDQNGGKLRCDYRRQHDDSIQYIDDVLTPILEQLKCRMVIFSDHGNLLPHKEKKLEEWSETEYTFHEDRVQIPLVIKSPENGVGLNKGIISLAEINEILLALMEKREYIIPETEYVKLLRSPVYNQALRSLYQKMGQETGLEAYEMFEFSDGHKIGIFANGEVRLYLTANEERIEDADLKRYYYSKVKDCMTVCNPEKLYL